MIPTPLFERMERIGRWQRLAIFAGTLLVMGALFMYTFYVPKEQMITELQGEIEILERKISQAKIKVRDLERLEKEWQEANCRFQEALTILPDSREIPALLRTITRQGEDSGLEFQLFSPQKENEKDFFVEIPVAIEVKGRFYDVVDFFNKVALMERIVNVLNVSMQPAKPLSTTLITKCTAVTYRFKGQVSEGNASPNK